MDWIHLLFKETFLRRCPPESVRVWSENHSKYFSRKGFNSRNYVLIKLLEELKVWKSQRSAAAFRRLQRISSRLFRKQANHKNSLGSHCKPHSPLSMVCLQLPEGSSAWFSSAMEISYQCLSLAASEEELYWQRSLGSVVSRLPAL